MLEDKKKLKYGGVGLIVLGVSLETGVFVPAHAPAWLGWGVMGLGFLLSAAGVLALFRGKGISLWWAILPAALPLYGPVLALFVSNAAERAQKGALDNAKLAASETAGKAADPRVRFWTGAALAASWLLELVALFALERAPAMGSIAPPLMLAALVASMVFLGLYAWTRGQNPACGLLAIIPVFGPPLGLLDLALGTKLSSRAPSESRVGMEKAREFGFVFFFFGLFVATSPAAGPLGAGMAVFGICLYLGYVGAAFAGSAILTLAVITGLIGGCSVAGTGMLSNPSWGGLIRKSSEGATKGNIGSIRSALAIYHGDSKGKYPADLAALTLGGKYLQVVPLTKTPNYHKDSSAVRLAKAPDDAGGWLYDGAEVFVNCTHTDTKGSVWTSY